MKEPTLGMIELKSVARGIVVTDAIAKKAQVKILEAHAVQPGKFIILICGEVADVEESLKEGVEVGSDFVINRIRSKKWQHFSTKVPPELVLNLFQSPTLHRNGKRCSRIVNILIPPVTASTASINDEIGGIYLYSMATQTGDL